MILKIRYTLVAAALLVTSTSIAQNPINQDVTVTRDYAPTVSDANKLDQMPTLDDTTSYNPTFSYSILSRAFETSKDIEPISPARLAADKKPNLTNSWAKAGLGNYNTFMGEFDYNILRSTQYALGLSLAHQSSLGSIKLEDGQSVESPFHDTYAGLNFKRFFSKLTLTSNLNYTHNIFDYFGYQTLLPQTEYFIEGETEPVKGELLMPESNQRFGLFNFGLGLYNQNSDKNATQWGAHVGFSSFGNRTGVHQNKVDVNAMASIPLSSFNLIIDANVSAYNVETPTGNSDLSYSFNDMQNTVLSINPRLGLPFEGGNLEAGLLLVGEIGNESDRMHVAPHLTAQLSIADGIVSLFGGIKGRFNNNNYATIAYENPFVAPDVLVQNSFHGINLHAGLKGSFSKTTSFTTRVNYSFFNNEHFFVNRTWMQYPIVETDPQVFDYANQFDVVYDDGKLLTVEGELLIKPNDAFNLRLNAAYYGWETDNELQAWHKPDKELGITANYKINKSLNLYSDVTYLGKRYAKVPESNMSKDLGSYVDVNAGVNYKFSRQWMLWSRINNGIAAKYYRWNGYPSFKANIMVGVGYSF